MTRRSGMLGRLCTCGAWHSAPRRLTPVDFVNTDLDPQYSDVAPLEGTLAEPIKDVNVLARGAQFALLLLAAGCGAAFIHSFFR